MYNLPWMDYLLFKIDPSRLLMASLLRPLSGLLLRTSQSPLRPRPLARPSMAHFLVRAQLVRRGSDRVHRRHHSLGRFRGFGRSARVVSTATGSGCQHHAPRVSVGMYCAAAGLVGDAVDRCVLADRKAEQASELLGDAWDNLRTLGLWDLYLNFRGGGMPAVDFF